MSTPTELHAFVTKSPKLRASTKKAYLRDLDQFIAYVGDDARGWTRTRTAQFYQHLLDAGMKPQSANRLMASVRYAAQWRAKRDNDPALDFTVIELASNKEKVPRTALSEAQLRALFGTCEAGTPRDRRDFALMLIAVETGMRRMSLASLTWEAIKAEPYPTISVPLKGRDNLFPVPISDAALAGLEPWRAWLKAHKAGKGAIFRRLDKHLSGVVVGAGISPQAIYAIIDERATQANVGHVHPHMFRHTFVTTRLNGGLSPFQVASITGHRLPGDGAGSLYGYTDKKVLGEQARLATPTWLVEYVARYAQAHA